MIDHGARHAFCWPCLAKSLVDSCPKLKRLYWKPINGMRLLPSAWSSILASGSLRTSIEALEVDCSPAFPYHTSTPPPAPLLELPSLRCLRLSLSEDNAPLISEIVNGWQLPSLMSLYLASSHRPATRDVISLVKTHGQSLTTLAMDPRVSSNVPFSILPPAPIRGLVYFGNYLETTIFIPFGSLSTLVACMNLKIGPPLTLDSFYTLKWLDRLPNDLPTELTDVVILGKAFDTLKEPHPIDGQKLTENQHLWVELWLKDTPRLVNRNGVRLLSW